MTAQPSTRSEEHTTPATRLRDALAPVSVHLPGDLEYDAARMPWNVTVDQRPAAVAVPADATEVALVVREAARVGLRVAAQSTGHAAAPLAGSDLSAVVLLRTARLHGVSVDPEARVARVGSGAEWQHVVEAAAAHGLAALHGSSPDVGVAGYTLGGGIGWYARKHGLAANNVVALEVALADGRIVRADEHRHADLFWALRGGGGSFGVVTSLELRLFPIQDAYAGMLVWDLEHAEPVLRRWAEWSATAPDEATTSLRFMRFPPMPELPDFLRGRRLVIVDGAFLCDDDAAAAELAGLRELAPEMDTFARVPAASLSRLHMDPEGPTPFVGGSAMVRELDGAAVDAFLEATGPASECGVLMAELRQLGGALARPHRGAGPLPQLDASHVAFFVAVAPTPEMGAAGVADVDRVLGTLAPHCTGGSFLNLAERRVDTSAGYRTEDWLRLQRVRSTVDPDGLFLANHDIPAR